jgi:transposase
MPAYDQRAPLITRVVGAHPPGGAGLHSRAGSQSGGIGGDGPAVAGAAATGLAHLVAPPVKPERCQRCQQPLQGEDPQLQRHQVTEILPMKPVITEYRVHRLVCPAGGEATRAALPAGVSPRGFGPRVQAITALCTGAYHLSKRTTQSVLQDLFGVPLGVGTITNLEHATVQALVEPVAEARTSVQAQPAAYLDEPGWREGLPRAWLWTAVTSDVTVFVVRLSRRATVAQELLGEPFWGWLVTDRWSA